MDNTLRILKQSKIDLDQINKKIALEKNRLALKKNLERKLDTNLKRELGKTFLLSGIGRYISIKTLKFNKIIQLGAFLIISDLHYAKRSAVLGGLSFIFNQCERKITIKKQCEQLGADHFQENKKLSYPFSLFLGVALKAQDFLSSEENYNKADKIGDNIFTQHRQNKTEKFKRYLIKKHTNQGVKNESERKETRKIQAEKRGGRKNTQ